MLNSCASNVVVVNIDAGFNGGHVAGLIARRAGLARLSAAGPAPRAPSARAKIMPIGPIAAANLVPQQPDELSN